MKCTMYHGQIFLRPTDAVLSRNSPSINGTGYYDANIFPYFFFSRPFFTSLAVFLQYGAFYGSYFYLTNPEITSASVKRKSISSKPIDQLNLLTWMTNIKKPKFKSFILNSFNDLTSSQNWYFVTKIVLTYCEKKLFQRLRKTFEISRLYIPTVFCYQKLF